MAPTRQYADKKGSSASSRIETVPEPVNPQVTDSKGRNKDDILEDLDDVLDEIDNLLAANAQEFVEAYVQKGGE